MSPVVERNECHDFYLVSMFGFVAGGEIIFATICHAHFAVNEKLCLNDRETFFFGVKVTMMSFAACKIDYVFFSFCRCQVTPMYCAVFFVSDEFDASYLQLKMKRCDAWMVSDFHIQREWRDFFAVLSAATVDDDGVLFLAFNILISSCCVRWTGRRREISMTWFHVDFCRIYLQLCRAAVCLLPSIDSLEIRNAFDCCWLLPTFFCSICLSMAKIFCL